MIKSILLILLCSPLVLVGLCESKKLVEARWLEAPTYPLSDVTARVDLL
jgi:hypothetical protein